MSSGFSSSMLRLVGVAAATAVLLTKSGCMVVGLAVGSRIPATYSVTELAADSIPRGAVVRAGDVKGRFRGLDEGMIHIERGSVVTGVPWATVDRVEVTDGSHAVSGFLIGLCVDLVVVGLAAAAVSSLDFGGAR